MSPAVASLLARRKRRDPPPSPAAHLGQLVGPEVAQRAQRRRIDPHLPQRAAHARRTTSTAAGDRDSRPRMLTVCSKEKIRALTGDGSPT